ncbi:MAG: tRNA lysidine(34) synthetase TilS [Bacteroidota bacterium]
MLESLLTYINSQNLFQKTDKILLAVSSGIDSIVLTDLFSKAKVDFAIAHVNFGLRGEESDADEVFVKKIATKYKVPFFTTTFETTNYATENGLSIQVAARILRYTWFEEIRQSHHYQYIATAHHLNDTAETLLLNIAKGTGIAGLHGILPKRGLLIRPLLFADREMIYDYLVENQLIWREDSSNESQKYQRNFIRQEIVPKFKEINPNFEETIYRTVEKVGDLENYFHYELEKFKTENLISKEGIIYLSFIKLLENPVLRAFYTAIFTEYNFGYTQIQEILKSLSGEAGKSFISASHHLVKDRTDYVIKPKNILDDFGTKEIDLNFETDIKINIQNFNLKFSKEEITENFKLKTSKKTASLDFETLKSPLKLRKWKEGDWFCPLGMNKKKNISDFLNSEKVPLNIKGDVYVLTSNGSIVWVIGHRIDNRFKIGEKSTKMLLIEQTY